MKSWKATLLDIASMEGVIPGYYGTRGARAMYVLSNPSGVACDVTEDYNE